MTEFVPPCRKATADDALALAELINFAGEGMPLYLWEKMAEPGETVWDVGQRRARREEGGFSYRNAVLSEQDGRVASVLIGYALPDQPETIDYTSMPAMFVPLLELENLVTGTWYVNVLATYPQFRRQGHGTRLLTLAERIAKDSGRSGLSIIVSDANQGARRLYEACGYGFVDQRPLVKDDWENPGKNWVLLKKSL